jgi:cyanophycinase
MNRAAGVKSVLTAIVIVGLATVTGLGGYLLYLRHAAAAVVHHPYTPQPGGALLICGGGDLPAEIFDRFVELAGGKQARLVVIPSFKPASEDAERLVRPWQSRGVHSVTILNAASRAESDDPTFIKPLARATGVWIGGGDQSWLASGTPIRRSSASSKRCWNVAAS